VRNGWTKEDTTPCLPYQYSQRQHKRRSGQQAGRAGAQHGQGQRHRGGTGQQHRKGQRQHHQGGQGQQHRWGRAGSMGGRGQQHQGASGVTYEVEEERDALRAPVLLKVALEEGRSLQGSLPWQQTRWRTRPPPPP